MRERVEAHLWARLGAHLTEDQQGQLEALLRVPEGAENFALDDLRNGPFTISAPALVRALRRLKSVRSLGFVIPLVASIPPSRIASLARFADKAKASAVMRLSKARRLATLAAFIYTLEASAQDDAIELLEVLLAKVFGEAEKKDKKARMGSGASAGGRRLSSHSTFNPRFWPHHEMTGNAGLSRRACPPRFGTNG